MPVIELKGVSNFILDNVNLKIMDKELLVLLGPTGAGKTTILNTIAGLVPYQGSVLFDGRPVDTIPTDQRGVGYLFQSLALFPHLDVASNIAYSLKVKEYPPQVVKEKVNELLKLMKIEHLTRRYPKNLSGGEKQRVALARALASSPRVLLLDEPLASIDMRFSKYLRMEFRHIQKQLGITTIYVTHDFSEAEEMGERIAVVYNGKIEQIGKYDDIFFSPRNERISDFIGEPNILNCEYSKALGDGLMEVGIGGIPLVIPHEGDEVKKIAIHPGHIHVYKDKPPGPGINRLKGVIVEITPVAFMVRIKVKIRNNILLVELSRDIFEDMDLRVGKEVFLVLKLKWIKVLNGR